MKGMNLPDPLHPAIVHFPIVLILLGTAIAAAALAFPRTALAWFSAAILASGAMGAVAATWSGDEDEDKAEHSGAAAKQVFEEHEEWGERARNAAILAALAAAAAAVSRKRLPGFSRVMAALTAIVALAASWCVIEAGHYGGQLVYQHGVGVKLAGQASSGKAAPDKKFRHRDDD
jgi:uncharacterized membrane protein